MDIAQKCSSLVLALRKKEKLRVRQPLQRIMIPALHAEFQKNLLHVKELILSEVNVKELDILDEASSLLVKKIKPNFKTIGPKYGKFMKDISALVAGFDQDQIRSIEQTGKWEHVIEGQTISLESTDFEITTQDIPGWLVASEGEITVALDITLTDELKAEGVAREVVNRVQNIRKESGLEVTDKIALRIETTAIIQEAIVSHKDYICSEVLANDIQFNSIENVGQYTDILEAEDTKIELRKD
jgi:isoleucyl-tRNA synthetase